MSQALPAGAALDRTPVVRVQRVPKAAFRDCQKQHPVHPDLHLLRINDLITQYRPSQIISLFNWSLNQLLQIYCALLA
jgi:hypothetical protein